MAEIDRLGWAAGFALVSHGARIGVRATEASVLERLAPRLPPGSAPAPSPVVDTLYSLVLGGDGGRRGVRRYHLLYVDAARAARTLELEDALAVLEADLDFRVALHARDRLFVHAGVVGWQGRAVVLPGSSGSGKTSLVAAMVRAGATYYSDEYAVFDDRGRVHPYPRPLSFRKGAAAPQESRPVESLGGEAGSEPLPLGLVAVTEYRPGARWRPRVLSPAQALLALLGHTVVARARPAFALSTLGRAVTGGVAALEGARGEAREAALRLLDLPTRTHPNPRRNHATRSEKRRGPRPGSGR